MKERKSPKFGPIPRFIAKDCLRRGEVINTVMQCVVPRGDSRIALVYWLIYRGKGKQPWRWRLYARNGLVIGASSEAYRRRGGAVENAALLGCPIYQALKDRGVWTTGSETVWDWGIAGEPGEIEWMGAR